MDSGSTDNICLAATAGNCQTGLQLSLLQGITQAVNFAFPPRLQGLETGPLLTHICDTALVHK
jgi:hypothetical protein